MTKILFPLTRCVARGDTQRAAPARARRRAVLGAARVALPAALLALLAFALAPAAPVRAQSSPGTDAAEGAPAVPAPAPAPPPSPAAPAGAAAQGAALPAAATESAESIALPPSPCPTTMGAAQATLAPVPPATAALIRERLTRKVGKVASVCRTPFGLYEVIVDGEFFYVDERANYLITGNAFDLRTADNLTAQRKEDAFRIDFKVLPLQLAVKTVRGDGSRVMAIFEDPNCPYCKRFEKDIAKLTNATIYTFLYPILSRDAQAPDDSYPKSKAIWCAADRPAAWAQVMLEGRHLEAAPESCKDPLDEILALGQKLHISGTPTILFVDGRRAPGMIPMDRVERMMAEAAHAGKTQ